MNIVNVEINIEGNIIIFEMKLTHQDLYFFNQRCDKGKEEWIKSYLNKRISVLSIK